MISADAIRGYVDLMVLSVLSEADSYPYELLKKITEVSDEDYVIKQTTLYSAVKRLEDQRHVESYKTLSPSGKSRTYYHITKQGYAHLRHKSSEWIQIKNLVDKFIVKAS